MSMTDSWILIARGPTRQQQETEAARHGWKFREQAYPEQNVQYCVGTEVLAEY